MASLLLICRVSTQRFSRMAGVAFTGESCAVVGKLHRGSF